MNHRIQTKLMAAGDLDREAALCAETATVKQQEQSELRKSRKNFKAIAAALRAQVADAVFAASEPCA